VLQKAVERTKRVVRLVGTGLVDLVDDHDGYKRPSVSDNDSLTSKMGCASLRSNTPTFSSCHIISFGRIPIS
jgi:hypothetical protein